MQKREGKGKPRMAHECDFWGAIAAVLLHDVQLTIIEAMWWLKQPLSAIQLTKMLDDENQTPVGHVSYHFRRLAELAIIEYVKDVPRRGARENFYFLVTLSQGEEKVT
jgi:hypothetical protein